MKTYLVSFLSILFLSNVAAAFEINCSASNQTAVVDRSGKIVRVGEKVDVPVEVLSGPFASQPQYASIAGSKVSVVFHAGSDYETQTLLKMNLDDVTSTVYDVKTSNYMLEKNGIIFQCFFQAGN
jgi:hypothetical protein